MSQAKHKCSNFALIEIASAIYITDVLSMLYPVTGTVRYGQTTAQHSQVNALGVLKNTYRRILGVAAVRANARMKLRVLGTLLGRSNDAQNTSAARQEAHFREAEWDNDLRHGPRGQAEYHHGFEHCI